MITSCTFGLALLVAATMVQGKVTRAGDHGIKPIDDLCVGVQCASPPDFCVIIVPSNPKTGFCCPLYECRHPSNPCDGHKCPHEGKCVVKDGQPTCLCPKLCTPKCQPVCAVTSSRQYHTFKNKCELNKAACSRNEVMEVVSHGPCPNHFPPCSIFEDPCWDVACPDIACPFPILSKRSVAKTRADCCPRCEDPIIVEDPDVCRGIVCAAVECPFPILSKRSVAKTEADCCPRCDDPIFQS